LPATPARFETRANREVEAQPEEIRSA